MKLFRYMQIALESILLRKMRSFLTMLGIIIGVASVVLTVGIGRGTASEIADDIASQGTNLLTISAGFGPLNTLTMADVALLANPAMHPELVAVAPEYTDALARLVYKTQSIEVQATGTTAEYATVRNVQVTQGRFLDAEDNLRQKQVVVLSAAVASELFGDSNAVGQSVRINGQVLTVIGILKASSGSFSFGSDKRVFVPLTLALKRLFEPNFYRGEYTVTEINVQVKSQQLLKDAEYKIERNLRLQHALQATDKNDFTIVNQARLLELANNISQTLTLFLGSIGAISLLVGGIGIMNIMLVSVTERTREIGLRKALGAQDRDVLLQFLIEALTLTLCGGMLGAALSYAIAFVMQQLPATPFQVVLEPQILLMAMGVSLICGFAFGLYPALRATQLDPIEALRYE